MKRKHILATAALLAAFGGALSGCGDDQAPQEARRLWERLQAEDYRSWARAPGFEEPRPSRTLHDARVLVYVNSTVAEVLRAGAPAAAWPEGSLIVKEGMDEDGEVTQVAAMEKRSEGWFWAEWSPEGESSFSGQPEICLGCHRIGDDWTRAVLLP